MRVKFLGTRGGWNDVVNSARTTINIKHEVLANVQALI